MMDQRPPSVLQCLMTLPDRLEHAGKSWPESAAWRANRHALERVIGPAVVIDLDVVRSNIQSASRIAQAASVALVPHVKTHKSLRLASMQRDAGAAGLTAAKPGEAAVFLRGGAPMVTVAFPVLHQASIDMLLAAAAHGGASVRFVVDSETGAEVLASVAQRRRLKLPTFMEVDTGLRRCGVQPSAPGAIQLATRLCRTPGLDFLGLLSHAGHAYAATGPAGIRAIAAQERTALLTLAEALEHARLPIRERSVGCTPTVFLNDGFAGLTEIRPGNYVFMDLVQVALGVARPSDIALQVLATVVSANTEFAIIDAGSKVLSSDKAPHGSDAVAGYGLAVPMEGGRVATVVKLSEEHGFVTQPEGHEFRIGERLRVYPNHACPVANLAANYLVLDGTGRMEHWPVNARGPHPLAWPESDPLSQP